MMNCEILPSGDLALSIPDAGDRAEFREELERFGYWSAMANAFESYACNGSFTHFDAGQGNPFVGLTSAPCVAESMTTEDDGTNVIEGRCWYFANYALDNDAEQLADGQTVTYQEAR